MPRTISTLCLLLLLLLAATPEAGAVLPVEFQEDFTTTTFKNEDWTSAVWDTVAGEIRLGYQTPEVIGSLNPSGIVYDVEPYGRYLLLAAQSLLVVDLIDPAAPAIVAVGSLGGNAQSITAAGEFAYVACGPDGLKILDVSDPLSPALVATWATSATSLDVAVSGNFAYVADGTGLQILDITDPASPDPEGRLTLTCKGVVLSGAVAYVAAGSSGLAAVEVSEPRNPILLDSALTNSTAYGVDAAGDLVCVAADDGGLAIFDVSDPANLAAIALAQTNDAVGVRIDGEFAYVADRDTGMRVYDLRNPGHPVELGIVATEAKVYNAVLHGRHLLMCDGEAGLKVLEAADLLAERFRHSGPILDADILDIAVSGTVAYLATYTAGLVAVDISNPSSPSVVGQLGSVRPLQVAVSGNLACLAARGDGLIVVDISDPSAMTQVAAVARSEDVAMDGHYVYSLNDGDLEIWDLQQPPYPSLRDSYSHVALDGIALAQDGNIVVVIDDNGASDTAYLFDVRDPDSISSLGGYTMDDISDLTLRGSMIYAVGPSGLFTHSVMSFGGVTIQDEFTNEGFHALVVDGDRLYAAGSSNVRIFDVSDPGDLQLVDWQAATANSLARSGDYLLMGTDIGGARLDMLEILQRRFDLSAKTVRSLDIYAGEASVGSVKLNADPTSGDIDWYVDSHWGYQLITSPYWTELPVSEYNDDLSWIAEIQYPGGGVSPVCTLLDLEWRYDCGAITEVADVPNDQGRQVRLRWKRSAFDYAYASKTVTEYAIYRLIDDPARAGAEKPDLSDGKAYPPGDWDYLLSVPAALEDDYSVVVPTLADSTVSGGLHLSSFFVRAFTTVPGDHFDSPVESGWSLDNLAPAPPAGLKLGGTLLTWDDPVDADFDYFTVYGSETGTLNGTEILLGYTSGTEFDVTGSSHEYYMATATDFSGNEGEPGVVANGLSAVDGAPPTRTALLGNHPNPFNPATVIRYDLPEPMLVRLHVYDASGRLVRTLLNAVTQPAGRQEARWDGKDDGGRSVASGTYFYRLSAGGQTFAGRMALVR